MQGLHVERHRDLGTADASGIEPRDRGAGVSVGVGWGMAEGGEFELLVRFLVAGYIQRFVIFPVAPELTSPKHAANVAASIGRFSSS